MEIVILCRRSRGTLRELHFSNETSLCEVSWSAYKSYKQESFKVTNGFVVSRERRNLFRVDFTTSDISPSGREPGMFVLLHSPGRQVF